MAQSTLEGGLLRGPVAQRTTRLLGVSDTFRGRHAHDLDPSLTEPVEDPEELGLVDDFRGEHGEAVLDMYRQPLERPIR